MPDTERERRVISEWVLLQRKLGVAIDEIRWLDTNQKGGDIEALAPPFAIEHTSVDRIENQRRHDEQFKRVVKDLNRIELTPPARLSLLISLEDFLNLNHNKLRTEMDQWLRKEASELNEGHSTGNKIGRLSVRWWCWKYKNRPPRIKIGFSADIEKYSKDISDLIKRKSHKLGGYKQQSFTTVLIVESYDFQLMAPDVFLEMVLGVPEENKKFIDQIWFADTSLNDIEFWRVMLEVQHLEGPYNKDEITLIL
jgi:hypothetical protein